MNIPNDIVDNLHNLNCEEVAKRFNIEVKNHMAHCFKHEDRVASLGFRRNHWKCFSCDVGGDAISLIRELFSVSFQEACIILCDEYGIQLPIPVNQVKKYHTSIESIRRKQLPKDEKLPFDKEVAEFVMSHTILTSAGEEFLYKQRKLFPQIVEVLRIHSVENESELKQLLIDKFGIERLKQCKLINSTNRHLTINCPSLIIPYYDEYNQLISLQTRYLGKDNPLFRIPRFKRLCNSPIRLYNMNLIPELRPDDRLFVAEGITDCIALLSDGYNAVAIPSATSLPTEDLSKLRQFQVYMVCDNDRAGRESFRRLYNLMLRYGCIVRRISLSTGIKDYSEYFLAHRQ